MYICTIVIILLLLLQVLLIVEEIDVWYIIIIFLLAVAISTLSYHNYHFNKLWHWNQSWSYIFHCHLFFWISLPIDGTFSTTYSFIRNIGWWRTHLSSLPFIFAESTNLSIFKTDSMWLPRFAASLANVPVNFLRDMLSVTHPLSWMRNFRFWHTHLPHPRQNILKR